MQFKISLIKKASTIRFFLKDLIIRNSKRFN